MKRIIGPDTGQTAAIAITCANKKNIGGTNEVDIQEGRANRPATASFTPGG